MPLLQPVVRRVRVLAQGANVGLRRDGASFVVSVLLWVVSVRDADSIDYAAIPRSDSGGSFPAAAVMFFNLATIAVRTSRGR